MKKYFLIVFFLSPLFASSMEDSEYEKWIHNVYLKHYKDPISNSDWNSRIQNIPKQYKLKHKDNLWDLSGSFLRDSLYWSKLWVINPKVENPHLIYKDNFIKFDPLALSQVNKSKLSVDIQDQFPGLALPPAFSKGALSEDQLPSSLPNIPIFVSFKDEIDLKQLHRTYRAETQPAPFYLSDDVPSLAGEILGKDDYGEFFGVSGEKVILRLDNNVPIGTYFTVFKNKGRVGNFLSSLAGQSDEYEIQVKGILKVVSYIQGTGSLYKARVISAIDQMSAEDSIFKGSPVVYSFSERKIAKGEGSIIGSPYKTRLFLTTGSIVFLNKGSADGLYKEAVFYIRPNTEKPDFFKRPYNYEGAILGKLKVIHVSRNKATAVILSARDKIYVGDAFAGQVSAFEMEKVEEADIGQDLLMDFEETDSKEEKAETSGDQELKEREEIDFEEIEQEEMLGDPEEEEEEEEDKVLKEDFEEEESNEMGEEFELEVERDAEEENLEDYEKDKHVEEHYEVDALEWNQDLSKDKKEIKDLNKEIKDSREDLEELEEDLEEKELEFDQLEDETLEQDVQQKLEENEDLEFELEDEEILEEGDLEAFEEEGVEDFIEEDLEDAEDLSEDEEDLEDAEDLLGDEEDLEDTEDLLEDDKDEEDLEEELEEPKNELEELEEIDTL
ncbi:MAG: hypothetical protein OXJ52_02325 [Oligoflexia bacterium]|nr:hypothetical protein [Oligoflexia bacterium]